MQKKDVGVEVTVIESVHVEGLLGVWLWMYRIDR
jgi:hypothetical protein